MTLTIEQLHELSHFLNASSSLPVHIQKLADELKEALHPTKVGEEETIIPINKHGKLDSESDK